MELSRTSHLALRATLFLAAHCDEGALPRETIATAIGAPENYLAKVLNRLRVRGLVRSKTGPGGGYRLARSPSEIRVREIFGVFESKTEWSMCLLGARPCDPAHPCQAHEEWERLSELTDRTWDSSRLSDFVECKDEVSEKSDSPFDSLPFQGASR